MKLTKKNAENYLLQMYQIRAFEEQAEKSYMAGKIHGTMHLSIGQEASAIGSISTLDPTDFIIGHHRGHGLCIAKGADLNLMMAEFYGKENGYCRGRGGSMHIADIAGGNLGANGVVGGGIPMAVGIGIGLKMKGENQVLWPMTGQLQRRSQLTARSTAWPEVVQQMEMIFLRFNPLSRRQSN